MPFVIKVISYRPLGANYVFDTGPDEHGPYWISSTHVADIGGEDETLAFSANLDDGAIRFRNAEDAMQWIAPLRTLDPSNAMVVHVSAPRLNPHLLLSEHTSLFVAAGNTDACTICHEQMSDRICRRLHCGHEFHHGCVDGWLAGAATCPLCRRHITDEISDDAP